MIKDLHRIIEDEPLYTQNLLRVGDIIRILPYLGDADLQYIKETIETILEKETDHG